MPQPTHGEPAPSALRNLLASWHSWLPTLMVAVVGGVGVLITTLVAKTLTTELGFPTLFPAIWGNFEESYALMLFILLALVFLLPASVFVYDKNREFASFTGESLCQFGWWSAVLAGLCYMLTYLFPAQNEYWTGGFIFLTTFWLFPWTSNPHPTKKSGAVDSRIVAWVLRGLFFMYYVFMCLVSFSIPLVHVLTWIYDGLPKRGLYPFNSWLAIFLIDYLISATSLSWYYYQAAPIVSLAGTHYYGVSPSPQGTGSSLRGRWRAASAVAVPLSVSVLGIIYSMHSGEMQNYILGALNERVDVPPTFAIRKSLCGDTASRSSTTTADYLVVNYSRGGTSYWACYTSANRFLWHGDR